VYGTFAVLVGLAGMVLATIGAVRLIDNYLPSAAFGEEHTWAAYLIVGLVFVIAGVVLWVRRYGGGPEDTPA
jgi:multisubunit Na+/H+ antiporter MnhG subunit